MFFLLSEYMNTGAVHHVAKPHRRSLCISSLQFSWGLFRAGPHDDRLGWLGKDFSKQRTDCDYMDQDDLAKSKNAHIQVLIPVVLFEIVE